MGMSPRKFLCNEYALRCNLVHFDTKFEKCHSGTLFFSRDHVPCHIVSLEREYMYLLHVHRTSRF